VLDSRRRRRLRFLFPVTIPSFFSGRGSNDIPERVFLPENDQELLPKSLLKQLPSLNLRFSLFLIPDSFGEFEEQPESENVMKSDPCSNFEISMGAGV